MGNAFGPEHLAAAMERIRAWQARPGDPVSCPVCEAPGLEIADRSARPYSEWYILSCSKCGLEQTINIPMAPPAGR